MFNCQVSHALIGKLPTNVMWDIRYYNEVVDIKVSQSGLSIQQEQMSLSTPTWDLIGANLGNPVCLKATSTLTQINW